MAVFNRTVPKVWCKGDTAKYRRFEQIMRMTGLYPFINAVGRRQFKRQVPFPVLWQYYIYGPRRGVAP